jgi:hypothetical protein
MAQWKPIEEFKEGKVMHFDGPCPLLTCFYTGPHSHPICPRCGAVGYGNLTCPVCREHIMNRHHIRAWTCLECEDCGYQFPFGDDPDPIPTCPKYGSHNIDFSNWRKEE